MKDETPDLCRGLRWGVPASLILHALLIALLVHGLPRASPQPQDEPAINVALVPPPERSKPQPAPQNPEAEKPPEPKVEKQPVAERPQQKPAPVEVLKPVFQFGDKDSGPRESPDGSGAEDEAPPPPKAKQAGPPQDAEKNDPDEQAALAPDADTRPDAASAPLAAGSGDEIALPAMVEAPKPRPAGTERPANTARPGSGRAGSRSSTETAAATPQNYSGLPGVRRLYSQGATGDALASASMAGVPRAQRAARLCASMLQQQLMGASYLADLVPLIPLQAGNVLDVPETAFRTRTTWHRLGFRCAIDPDATRVLSFDFHVGAAIPRQEWPRLGLPALY